MRKYLASSIPTSKATSDTRTEATAVRLGYYTLPNLTRAMRRRTRRVQGHEVRLIGNGTCQLAMVSLAGWGKLEALDTNGLNPVQSASTLLNAAAMIAPGGPAVYYGTLMRWKKSGTPWTDAELLPVRQLAPVPGGMTVILVDGRCKLIAFPQPGAASLPSLAPAGARTFCWPTAGARAFSGVVGEVLSTVFLIG